ncbi:MAG: hypothetical protein VKQ33_04005 [Candidatus Sericytochromatia bacterium]|nr:hypothetical protein [Candidatus Sericytochromatia bacterium]
MTPLFRPRVASAQDALAVTAADGTLRPLAFPICVRDVPVTLSAPDVRLAFEPLSPHRPVVRDRRSLAEFLGAPDAPFDVRVVVDLGAARRVPMVRALVPAEALGAAAVDRWLERVANARRVLRTRLELVGIFPDLPLTDASTIKLDAGKGEARYVVGEGTYQRTTIAVARRKDTGESVVARLSS